MHMKNRKKYEQTGFFDLFAMRVIWIFSIKNFILITHSNHSRAFIEPSCFVFFYFFPNNFINELCACSTHILFCLFVWLSHAFDQIVPNGTAITVSNLTLIFSIAFIFRWQVPFKWSIFHQQRKKRHVSAGTLIAFFQNYRLFNSSWFVGKIVCSNSIGWKWFNGFVCMNFNYTVSSFALRQSGLENQRHCTRYNSNN